jgi:hypothetical protein
MATGSEFEIDPEFGITIINESEVSTEELTGYLKEAVRNQAPEVAALRSWAMSSQGATRGGTNTIFNRDKYVTPDNVFAKMRLAADAARTDDIVSNAVETTEQLAFKRIVMECEDQDEQNIWNQIIDELNLEQRMREAWRETFVVSQAYAAVIFQKKDYKVKGKGDKGTKRKKTFNGLMVPAGITFLDPLKVVPVGNFMFGQEQLVYIADREEVQEMETMARENTADLVVKQLLLNQYQPSRSERKLITESTGQSDLTGRLWVLNPKNVWRITATRSSYQRFADIRMESIFELLDLKTQLKEMDRAVLLGSTNAIILVKKGSDTHPAQSAELQQLAAEVKTTSRIPIIVSDNRLEIEIITPKNDNTLEASRYDMLNRQIATRLYQMLTTGSSRNTDDSMKLLRVMSSTMEARRDQIRDSFMDNLFDRVFELNDSLTSEPRMAFYPRNIALDFDPNKAQFLLDSRDRGDLSRDTILAELDIRQEDEYIKRKREAELYDDAFTPTNVPFDGSTPGQPEAETKATPKAAGRAGGGNSGGGGRNPASSRPSPSKNPSNQPKD